MMSEHADSPFHYLLLLKIVHEVQKKN